MKVTTPGTAYTWKYSVGNFVTGLFQLSIMAPRFTHVVVFVRISLLFKTEYFIVCVCHVCSSIHLAMDTWLFPPLGHCEYCCYINTDGQSWLSNRNCSVITIITVANVYWVLSVRSDVVLNALSTVTHLILKQLHELVTNDRSRFPEKETEAQRV